MERMTDLLNMIITDYPKIIYICTHKRKFWKFLSMFWAYFLRHIFVIDQSMLPIFIEKDKPLSSHCWTSFICSYECSFWKLYKYFQTIFVHFFNLKVIIRELQEDDKSVRIQILRITVSSQMHIILVVTSNMPWNQTKCQETKFRRLLVVLFFFLKSSNFRPFFFPVLMKKEIPYFWNCVKII